MKTPYEVVGGTPPPKTGLWAARPWWWWIVFIGPVLVVAWVWVMVALPPHPLYEYRLVTPTEAMQLVNNEGWRVSERVQMTDAAVYVYHR